MVARDTPCMSTTPAPDDDAPVEALGPSDEAYALHLSEPELKLTHTALHALLDDLGHEEHDLIAIVRGVLAKLPDEHAIRAIRLP